MRTWTTYFHPAGRIYIGIFVGATMLFWFLSLPLFLASSLLTAWCFYFFRNPDRVAPSRDGLIISPADGKVVAIQEVAPTPDLALGGVKRWRISIFLNLFDVHVNRMPADGVITGHYYRKGTFVNASLDKASENNERMALNLKLSGAHPYAGQEIGVVQIAGLVARRIICDAKEGDSFKAGQRYGIIRFGSRADIYLPAGLQPLVAVGQYMIGGETVLADCTSNEPQRVGEKR